MRLRGKFKQEGLKISRKQSGYFYDSEIRKVLNEGDKDNTELVNDLEKGKIR